ncbi:MAG: type II toxin-antitoxin system RatA family toxin [Gammaproteobacteria bacterium]|nr:type II toxin-antitoxin system RatA family toxin [Pseudomonadales bacterium]MCP5347088.1 type II toxin-antitoxin system RatA family toxin [Pseudomonadales bacterium]
MTRIDRSALVNYSAEQMFRLVNDIESYPEFMHGCTSARVLSASDDELVGELTLSKAGIRHTFTTRNVLEPGRRMSMELVEGAFRHFSATWHFNALTEDACKVSLEMEFEFASGLMNFAMEKLFSSSANSLVDAVVQRAHSVYEA